MENKKLIHFFFNSINTIGIIFLFFAPVSVIFFSFKEQNFSIVIWWIFLYLLGILISLLSYRKYARHLLLAFVIVYSISTVAVNFIYNDLERHYGIPFNGYDDIHYNNNALEAVEYGIDGFDDAIYYFFKKKGHNDGSYYYTAFIATIYNYSQKLGFKIHSVIPRYLNSFFLGLLGLIAFAFGNLIKLSLNAAKVAGYSASLWPLILYHSAIIRRDTIFAFFLLLSIYLISLFLDNKNNIKVIRLLFLASSISIVSLLRSGFFSIYILLFILLFFSYYKNIIFKILYRLKLIHFVIGIFFLLLIFKLNIIPDFMGANRKEFFEQFSNYLSRRGGYSEKGFGSFIFRLPLIFSIPSRLIYASISPFPSPTYLSYNIRWLGTIPWFISLPILVRSLSSAIRTKEISFLPLKFLSFTFIVYYIVINIVSFTETQQMMYIPLGILLIFYGVENQKTSLKSIYSVNGMILLSVILFILYIILKLLIIIFVK